MSNLDIQDADPIPANTDIPHISIDEETRERIILPWRRCLIGKVMGKTIDFKYMQYMANKLWKPTGFIQILDLGHDYNLFKFTYLQDLKTALFEGRWFINGHFFIPIQMVP